MISKHLERKRAIQLRKNGFSYSEILKNIPVAKSTLSLWLRDVGLSKRQKQTLTEKKLKAALKGAEIRRMQRIRNTEIIYKNAEKEINKISNRELWLIGISLYWAEGTKESRHKPGTGVEFTNSDPYMIRLFLKWLIEIGNISRERLHFGIYIYENHKNRTQEVIKHWSQCTSFSKNHFKYIYFKKHNPKTKRKNIENDYYGNLKIKVKASSEFNRRIMGWIRGINKYY